MTWPARGPRSQKWHIWRSATLLFFIVEQFFLPLDSSRRDEHDPKKKNRKKSKLWGVFASKNLDPLKSKFWKTEISAWKISSRWFQITPEFCNSTNGCLRKADPILTSSAISWQRIKTKRQPLTEAGGVIFWVTDKCKVSLELGWRVLSNAALKKQKFEGEIFFQIWTPFFEFFENFENHQWFC